MKTQCLILFALLICGLLGAVSPLENQFTSPASSATRYEVVAWQENFETGAPGWTHYDGAQSPNNWHIYDYGGTQGNCWWMGDPALASGGNIGGYYDHQYLVLDTPARTLSSANATLTFKLRYNIEATAGATAPYTGWDACNIRVSTNGGTIWTPITGTPAYNMTSSYAFGFEHGEGPNIPGWGGVLTTWTNATFNLSAYIGQSVKIRFAFASDPAYSTGDAPAMFGMMVDDIAFGGYSNTGVNDGQMTWASLVPMGGDIWNLATDTTAPSPTHVMRNQNASGTYNPNMMNYLVSPPITLPDDGAIRADFMIRGGFTDPNTFPEVDYFGWEISPNGMTWYAMSNPYGDPNGQNYVYSDAPDVWSSMTESYTLDGLITNYHGQTVQFRWYFRSDADTPSGEGIRIDDFKIYNDIVVAAPENLEAAVSGTNVYLNWEAPGSGGGGGEEGWLSYCGENSDSIGTGAAADFDVAAKWDALGTTNSIYPYVGMNITKIKFWPAEAACSYAVRIWTGDTNTQVYNQDVTPTIDAWNEIVLTTPFTIPAGVRLMAGFRCNATAGYPAGCDAGPVVEGYGNMIRFNNAWTTLTALSATLTYNWNIQVYVADAAGREYVLGQLPQENVQPLSGTLSSSGVPRQNREVSAYKIYRDGAYVAQVTGTVLNYLDSNVPGGLHSYYVTAMYGTNESQPTNSVAVYVMPPSHVELSHDDGTAEQGYSVGATKQMAVKYEYPASVVVKLVKVYVHTPGTAGIVIRVFDNDGANGMPGTQMAQYQYPAASVIQGWNYIILPTEITVADGSFYVAILETANAALIGLDTSSNGFSYKKITTEWEPVTQGEVMMRPIVFSSFTDPFGNPVVLPTSMTVVAGVTIGGQQAANGDVLAAYVTVGGTPQLRGKQTVQVIEGIAGCVLQVYTETNGETISFKVWDMSANEVINSPTTLASIVNGTVGSWPGNLFMIDASASTTQSINLATGWNLISLNVSPANHTIASLIAPISTLVQQIKGTEGVYIPGNPYSTLTSLTDGRAYNILMSAASAWSVTGAPIPVSTPLALVDGWNMVAYLPQGSLPVATAVSSIATWLVQVKGTDGVYIPGNPYSTLTTMYPGKGYWIKINGAHSLIYPGTRDESEMASWRVGELERSVDPERANATPVLKPFSMTVLVKCNAASAGDILLAKVNGELRGRESFISPEGFPAALIQVYTDEDGEELSFSIMKPNGSEIPLTTKLLTQINGILGSYPDFISLEPMPLDNDDLVAIPTELIGAHPNPFSPNTTISFSVAKDNTPVTIEIYNIKGQKVRTLLGENLHKGSHSQVWNGTDDNNRSVSSGTYIITMKAAGYSKTTKALLIK